MRKDAQLSFCARFQAGLSLTELMVTLSVVSMLGFGVADFSRVVLDSKVDTGVAELRSVLAMARTESITRGMQVVLCRRAKDAEVCAGTSAEDDLRWAHGWLMYVDRNANKRFEPEDGDAVIRLSDGLAEEVRLLWNKGDYIAYKPSGGLSSRSGSFCVVAQEYNGQADHPDLMQALFIPYSGRVRQDSGGCVHQLLDAVALAEQ